MPFAVVFKVKVNFCIYLLIDNRFHLANATDTALGIEKENCEMNHLICGNIMLGLKGD